MASVSPPPHDALDLGHALMEAMRETAVGFTLILIVASSHDIKTIIEAISLLALYNLYSFLSKWSIPMRQWSVYQLL